MLHFQDRHYMLACKLMRHHDHMAAQHADLYGNQICVHLRNTQTVLDNGQTCAHLNSRACHILLYITCFPEHAVQMVAGQ